MGKCTYAPLTKKRNSGRAGQRVGVGEMNSSRVMSSLMFVCNIWVDNPTGEQWPESRRTSGETKSYKIIGLNHVEGIKFRLLLYLSPY